MLCKEVHKYNKLSAKLKLKLINYKKRLNLYKRLEK